MSAPKDEDQDRRFEYDAKGQKPSVRRDLCALGSTTKMIGPEDYEGRSPSKVSRACA